MNQILSKQPKHQKRHRKLKSKSKKAFQKWLEASNEWVSAKQIAQENEAMENHYLDAHVREIEKRIDEAADAFEAARKALLKINKTTLN